MGYRLCSDNKTYSDAYNTITKDANAQTKVKKIRDVVICKLYQNNPEDFRKYVNVEEGFDDIPMRSSKQQIICWELLTTTGE
jgi:hypothetical protein